MTDVTLTKKNITYNHHAVASDTHGNKTYFCYASLASCQKQLEKVLAKGNLPKTAKITGKDNLTFKISTYQDDGFWFESEIKDGKSWRLWTPHKTEAILKKIVKKSKLKK
jgi:hypothetical protein